MRSLVCRPANGAFSLGRPAEYIVIDLKGKARAGLLQVNRWTLWKLELQSETTESSSAVHDCFGRRVSRAPCGEALVRMLTTFSLRCSMILVDSTRSGKRVPDALAKTVPTWCAVINRAVQRKYPDKHKEDWDLRLYCPSSAVSAQEKSQIEARLDGWVDALVVCQ